MATKLKAGDVVHIASGGPKMTISEPSNIKGRFVCEWQDENGSMRTDVFSENVLVKVDPDDPAVTSQNP